MSGRQSGFSKSCCILMSSRNTPPRHPLVSVSCIFIPNKSAVTLSKMIVPRELLPDLPAHARLLMRYLDSDYRYSKAYRFLTIFWLGLEFSGAQSVALTQLTSSPESRPRGSGTVAGKHFRLQLCIDSPYVKAASRFRQERGTMTWVWQPALAAPSHSPCFPYDY